MKKILLVILTLSAFSVKAQFNLDKSYQIQDGDVWKINDLDTAINEGVAGLNQKWDFSKIPIKKKLGTRTYKAYTSKLNDSFNGANFALISSENNDVVYYKSNDNEFTIVGNYFETPYGADTIKTFQINNPNQVYYNYPLEFNVIQDKSSKGTTESYYKSQLYPTVYRKSTTSTIIDSYGSMKLHENKFYDDVIRIKTVQIFSDSTNPFGMIGMETKVVTTTTSYNYYAKNNRIPLLAIHYIVTNSKSFMGNQTSRVKGVNLYGDYIINGIEDEVLSFNNLLYPNPVESNSFINIAENINKIEIYNNIGILEYIYEGEDRKVVLPLKPGIYMVKAISLNNKVFSSKLIVK